MATGDRTYIADKETLDKIYSIVSGGSFYGFIEHTDVDNPTDRIEYIGINKDYTPVSLNSDGSMNLGSWAGYHVIANNRPAMVGNDGIADYYLSENDYNYKEDGTTESDVANEDYDGDAMSWIDKVYKCEYMIGNDRYVMFSQTKLNDDFLPNGFIDNGEELSGVWIPMFYPTLDSNGKLRSLAMGYPYVNNNATTELTKIQERGGQTTSIGGALMNTIADLCIMWGKSTNTQVVYGYGNSSGYDSSDTTNYGKLENAVVGGGKFYGTTDAKSLNKILHSIVLATYNVWIRDPYTLCDNGVYKVSNDYSVCALDGTGYTVLSFPPQQAGGWQKYMNVAKGFGALPIKNGGSSITAVCDYYWINLGNVCVALRLGHCDFGLYVGLRFLYLNHAASYASWYVAPAFILKAPYGG